MAEDAAPLEAGPTVSEIVITDSNGNQGNGDRPVPMDYHQRFLELVDNPGWKGLLVDIVKSEGLDPWNIDITRLSVAFTEKIAAMKMHSFHLPATAVLASAILLRFKAEAWQLYPSADVEQEYRDDAQWVLEGQTIPDLTMPRRITQRRVTIDELINAVEDVIEKSKAKAKFKRIFDARGPSEELMAIAFDNSEDFDNTVDDINVRLRSSVDNDGLALYSTLFKEQSKREAIRVLLPLLHLATEDKLAIWQEEAFDDIFVYLYEGDRKDMKEVKKLAKRRTAC